jgi:hypothetical protein
VEAYDRSILGVDIPYNSDNWEDVYKTITLIGDQRSLLFTRDVFYAKLGLLLEWPIHQEDVLEIF